MRIHKTIFQFQGVLRSLGRVVPAIKYLQYPVLAYLICPPSCSGVVGSSLHPGPCLLLLGSSVVLPWGLAQPPPAPGWRADVGVPLIPNSPQQKVPKVFSSHSATGAEHGDGPGAGRPGSLPGQVIQVLGAHLLPCLDQHGQHQPAEVQPPDGLHQPHWRREKCLGLPSPLPQPMRKPRQRGTGWIPRGHPPSQGPWQRLDGRS